VKMRIRFVVKNSCLA